MNSNLYGIKFVTTKENSITFEDSNYNCSTINYDDVKFELNIDGDKSNIKLSVLFKALDDTFKGGEFWLDEVDDYVRGLKNEISELKQQISWMEGKYE